MTLALSAAILALLLAALSVERRARDRSLAAVQIRIHVNGTRGKSTVTRLIAGGLREAGIRTVGKTTGTAPRLLLPDGGERAVRRRAPASIREQLWLLREAHRLGAQAVVVECMAVDPELQSVCEREMIRSTIGVVTNVRLDHPEAMGATIGDVAAAMASTVPRSAVLVIGPTDGADILAGAARERGTRVVQAAAPPGGAASAAADAWMADNIGIALAVTREVGIADDIALRGMRRATPDPGAARRGAFKVAGRQVEYLDASAANDPMSLALVLGPRRDGALFVFHHRADRPARLAQFGEFAPWTLDSDAIIVTGDRPDLSTWRLVRRRMPAGRAVFRSQRSLAEELGRRLRAVAAPSLLVFCGNTKGLRVDAVVSGLGRG